MNFKIELFINQFLKTFHQIFLSIFLIALAIETIHTQESSNIRLNQIGFYPTGPKIAIVNNASRLPFYVIDVVSSDTVLTEKLSETSKWEYSGEQVSVADFSKLIKPGAFVVSVPSVGTSYAFLINEHVFQKISIGLLKGYYYQRASTSLLAMYAGLWARAAGHPDTSVLIHPSAVSKKRKENSTISSPRGWYDAGDYNKYIVNSGISTYTLLASYEHYPKYCSALKTNIPESNNKIPDVIDEALWNIRWMLTMQDPEDGGVYHKLTNLGFDGFVMPGDATTLRYVVMKTTSATLNFAAVMAQTARIAKIFSVQLPGFSDSCLNASLQAWKWARKNPEMYFNYLKFNSQYRPKVFTGEYGDTNVTDEFAWAAAELFVTTGQDSFLTAANPLSLSAAVPGWSDVQTLGLYTLAHYSKKVEKKIDTNLVRGRLLALANLLLESYNSSAYKVVVGADTNDFIWGSNGIAANQGMLLMNAFYLTSDSAYLRAALSNLDYLLGRNGTSYCFVTGFGSKSPMHIHHRPSGADGIDAPVPGLLVGGPNKNKEDRLSYPSDSPAQCFLDHEHSFASNENCINWNAPMVYLSVGLEALFSLNGLPLSEKKQR